MEDPRKAEKLSNCCLKWNVSHYDQNDSGKIFDLRQKLFPPLDVIVGKQLAAISSRLMGVFTACYMKETNANLKVNNNNINSL